MFLECPATIDLGHSGYSECTATIFLWGSESRKLGDWSDLKEILATVAEIFWTGLFAALRAGFGI